MAVIDDLGISPDLLQRVEGRDTNVAQDRFDARLWGGLVGASTELRGLDDGGRPTFSGLLQDVFAGYYKADPELLPAERVNAAHRVNRPLIERFLNDPETAQARTVTMLDELSAALATLATGRRLKDEIASRPELQDAMELAEEAASHQNLARNAQAKGDAENAARWQQSAENAAAQAAELMAGAGQGMRVAVRAAGEAGRDEANRVQATLAGWGLEPADLSRLPIDERIATFRRLSEGRMRDLADLVGRFRNLARARQKQRVDHSRDEIFSITVGDDLARMLPSEAGALTNPLRRLEFLRRYQEKQLLQYDLRAREPQGRGPIVALIDISGSMMGQRLDWADAVALGLVDTARRQKRDAYVVFFNAAVVREVAVPKGKVTPETITDIASVGASGGTQFEMPLARAVELIGASPRFAKADVVMVTDGECYAADEFLATFSGEKKRLGFRVWSVIVGGGQGTTLLPFSDKVWPVSALTAEVAGDVFEAAF